MYRNYMFGMNRKYAFVLCKNYIYIFIMYKNYIFIM